MTFALLVTGGAGFIGSAVARELSARDDIRVTWVAHHRRVPSQPGRSRVITRNIADPASIRGITVGADAVLHLAHAITGPVERLVAVNDVGARTIAHEAATTATRLVAVSTAAVYGHALSPGVDIHQLREAPGSAVSATRTAGDKHIVDAGGTVVRPHLVLGAGDRWVIPRAADLVARFGWAITGDAVHSVIDVDDLAVRLISAAVDDPAPPGVWLAAERTPRSLRPSIATELQRRGLRPADPTEPARITSSAESQALEHDRMLLSTNHYLTCTCANAPAAFRT
ncbi:NAD(P)-dependent oxidoreductase [Tsukamurella sp. 8F]|uniref:NAD-dependent epimerase/dehydratase family protein n=1 Tax=unclassified Tsukamurella TaxID=2633480 RepID=UPI0023B93928|nr:MULTISPECIES: NAD(P)-dependent oxidoreductase [unclassified Tsukamurella]MDF0531100.1 NAD(P)-dependent oxidoreductase [Tsukamurella sp. 8J]MDF0588346.1 NAD(P)-dependent oxidoreductase [Tsukamurella sp. 8F]